MALQTFTAGQILTAAQMNSLQANDYNQTVSTKTASYVLVAADKGTRIVMNSASATTITVNTSLFAAGDTLYLQNINTGVCTLTAGTATVTSAGPLTIPQWGSGTLYFTSASAAIYFPSAVTITNPALVLISATTIGSAVSTVTVTGAFSSTYENYKIVVSGGAGSTLNNIAMQLGATTTGYYGAFVRYNYDGTAAISTDNNAASFTRFGQMNTNGLLGVCDLIGPNLAKNTFLHGGAAYASTTNGAGSYNAFLNDTTQYTAFTLAPPTGTMTGGTIRVYGYANS